MRKRRVIPAYGFCGFSFIHYGYNFCYIGSHYDENNGPRAHRERNPTETIMTVDVVQRADENEALKRGYCNVVGRDHYAVADARHNNGINVLWVDGHATTARTGSRFAPGTYEALMRDTDTNNQWDRNQARPSRCMGGVGNASSDCDACT